MGSPDLADESLIPDTNWLADTEWCIVSGEFHIESDHVAMHENLIDQTHFPFLHPETVGTPEYARSRLSASRVRRAGQDHAQPRRPHLRGTVRLAGIAVAFAPILDPAPDQGRLVHVRGVLPGVLEDVEALEWILDVVRNDAESQIELSFCAGQARPHGPSDHVPLGPEGGTRMTVVVGYVPTPEGMAAVDHAIRMATLGGSRLVIVNSGAHGSDADKNFASSADWDALDERLTSIGLEHELRQPALAESPADEILRVAAELSADLIVIGLRRRSPVGKLILGSSSQRVLLEAGCPVLAVKASQA